MGAKKKRVGSGAGRASPSSSHEIFFVESFSESGCLRVHPKISFSFPIFFFAPNPREKEKKARERKKKPSKEKKGDRSHLKLNTYIGRPIANKYREGKMQRTLNRELKDLKLLKH